MREFVDEGMRAKAGRNQGRFDRIIGGFLKVFEGFFGVSESSLKLVR